ncbi:MAG: hypothetical protein IPK19_25650 [Chloroflexi bacterium]|nr:hypothetical protein [Chloroflexota bacterium]
MQNSLEQIPSKKLQELETLTRALVNSMRRTSLQNEPIYAQLSELERQLILIRQAQFDEANPTFVK